MSESPEQKPALFRGVEFGVWLSKPNPKLHLEVLSERQTDDANAKPRAEQMEPWLHVGFGVHAGCRSL